MHDQFGPFGGRVWLNTAHQGPLPRTAGVAAQRVIDDKRAPARIRDDAFFELPAVLKERLATLVGADPFEIALGNSTSYGIHAIANGLPLAAGDEVVLVEGDFPATVTPWLPLRERGVGVRLVRPESKSLTAEELDRAITPATRVLCCSWVFSFFGHAVDVSALGEVCRSHGVVFVVNGSQAVGARPVDVSALPVDALVSCGFKWLCGPYATGFAWFSPALLERLRPAQAYWLSHMMQADLSHESDYTLRADLGAAAFDVFGTANFMTFAPWLAAIELLLDLGIDKAAEHDQALIDHLLDGLDERTWRPVSPRDGDARSTLVMLQADSADRTRCAYDALARAGIDVAMRARSLRVSPHVHNTRADIDRLLEVLANV